VSGSRVVDIVGRYAYVVPGADAIQLWSYCKAAQLCSLESAVMVTLRIAGFEE